MFAYNPEKFGSLYETSLGQKLWAFLANKDTIARLETASELSKPAVEGIAERLIEEFNEDIMIDRVRQMVGHMVRQILEQRGWVLDQADVKVQSVPFTKAARYRKPNWFTFHAFRNAKNPRDVAITDRRQNATLPEDARWIFYATFASPLKAAVAFQIVDIQKLRKEVLTKGFKRVEVKRLFRSP